MISRRDVIQIRKLLRSSQFVSVVYRGPIYAGWNGRFLFHDADFFDKDGEAWCPREFIRGPTKDSMLKVIAMLSNANCKRGTAVRTPSTKWYR
jgi:hypothetical protein